MSSASEAELPLSVKTGDDGTEILVIDGHMRRRASGRGTLEVKLPPGIYKLQVRAGRETHEELIPLFEGREATRKFEPLPFASPAPLAATSSTNANHEEVAQRESRVATPRFEKTGGSWIFVMARSWRPSSQPADPPFRGYNPATELRLLTADGRPLASLDEGWKLDPGGSGGADPGPCATCSLEVDPGTYLLARDLTQGGRVVQTIVASPGWQTQVFLLERRPGAAGENTGFSETAILMSDQRRDGSDIPCFSLSDPDARLCELARLGLVDERLVLSDTVLNGPISQGTFRDPMLGLFAAHLLLLGLKMGDSDYELAARSLPAIVQRLRHLLGMDHADVEALGRSLGEDRRDLRFRVPPMLRRSWDLVLRATLDRPELVPDHSLADRVCDRLLAIEPWLFWREDTTQSPTMPKSIASVSASAAPMPQEDPLMEAMLLRGDARKGAATQLESTVTVFGGNAPPLPGDSEIPRLVASLGVPRGKLEGLLRNWPWALGEAFEDFLRRLFAPMKAINGLLAEIGWRFELAALGEETVDPRVLSAIFATEVGERRSVQWQFDFDPPLDESAGGPAAYLLEVADPSGGREPLPVEAVQLGPVMSDHAVVVVDVERVTNDGNWRIFLLSSTPEPDSLSLRAMFVLRRSPAKLSGDRSPADPLAMIEAGHLAEAWTSAIELGWTETRLTAFLALLFSKMGALVEEFFKEPSRKKAADRFPFRWLDESVTQEITPRYRWLRQVLKGPTE